MGRSKKSLVGKEFGKWTVLREDLLNKDQYICQCTCGIIKSVNRRNLMSGKSTSCGIKHRHIFDEDSVLENLINQKFGKLTVVDFNGVNENKKCVWKCHCDCGNYVYKTTSALLSKDSYIACPECQKKRRRKIARKSSYIRNYIYRFDNTYSYKLNSKNSYSNSKTGKRNITEVILPNSKKIHFRVDMQINKQYMYIGQFRTDGEAIIARNAAYKRYRKPLRNQYLQDVSNRKNQWEQKKGWKYSSGRKKHS